MSGIEEIKRKAKLSLDEMFDNQDVDKVINQQDDKMSNQQTDQQVTHQNEKRRFNTDYKSVNQTSKSNTKFTHRMTFWMTEEIYDTFNEIYAKRMLDKKKVDKGALICEAIQFWAENGQ